MSRKVKFLVLFISLVAFIPCVRAQQIDLIANTDGRKTISLDGQWRTIVDPYEAGYYDYRYQPSANGYFKDAKPTTKSDLIEYDFDTSESLTVPGDWNTQRERLLLYEGTIWYKKSFDYQRTDNTRIFVYFGAANYIADVYLNGEKIGRHEGGFTPFNFEITNLVREKANSLIVKVDNQRRRERLFSGRMPTPSGTISTLGRLNKITGCRMIYSGGISKMKSLTFRIGTAVLTFVMGISITAAWMFRSRSANIEPLNSSLKDEDSTNKATLEMVFVLDTTGSMGGLLEGAKQRIWGIVNEVMQSSSHPLVRIGLVAYRDHGDEYVTKVLPLTNDLDKVYTTLMDYRAEGGGDTPEDVRRALADGIRRAGWSQASARSRR